ncbi:GLPGLI family protein [Phnomibacter sp. MR]|uniref:GLPGLI family protein n=1 Tax=Phnomibacter sp. MR TaxID=3042318 RepID=UPI003A80E203
MKKTTKYTAISLTLFIAFMQHIHAQNAQCVTYKVNQTLHVQVPNSSQKRAVELAFTGYLFADSNQSLYYQEPLFLQEYPKGYIRLTQETGGVFSHTVPSAPRQLLTYFRLDSAVKRSRTDFMDMGMNLFYRFERGYQQWEMTNETKQIGNLKSQKSILKNTKDDTIFEVWFCADIPMVFGPWGIIDLPGLVLEATHLPSNMRFSIDSFNLQCKIPPNTFWPQEFNEPFTDKGTIRKPRIQAP